MLILEDRIGHGLAASYANSVSLDDCSGGVAAGEWLAAQVPGARAARFSLDRMMTHETACGPRFF
jgi:hypothetical protein